MWWKNSLIILLMVFCFQWNGLQVVSPDRFQRFQYDSQALVVGRLACSQQKGVGEGSGLLGLAYPLPFEDRRTASQYIIYEEERNVSHFIPYYSHPGGQGICFSWLSQLFGLKGATGLWILQCLTSFFSALVFFGLITWSYSVFGTGMTVGLGAGIITISWIVLFARNLYWMLGAFYLPFVLLLWGLERERLRKESHLPFVFWLLVGGGVVLKGWFNGFEYLSTFLIMLTVPVLFYAIWQKWSFQKWFKRNIWLALTTLIAYGGIAGVWMKQLCTEKGALPQAVDYLMHIVEKRTRGGALKQKDWDVGEVLKRYWQGDIWDFSHWLAGGVLTFSVLQFTMVLIACSLWYIWSIRKSGIEKERLGFALLISLWVALLAPLSWFVVFKEHSVVHFHMNNIVWQMPYTLWGILLLGFIVQRAVRQIAINHKDSCL